MAGKISAAREALAKLVSAFKKRVKRSPTAAELKKLRKKAQSFGKSSGTSDRLKQKAIKAKMQGKSAAKSKGGKVAVVAGVGTAGFVGGRKSKKRKS